MIFFSNEKRLHNKCWNVVHQDEEGKKCLEVRGCRRREKGINNMEEMDREEWRRKIKLGTERYENIDTLCVNKI